MASSPLGLRSSRGLFALEPLARPVVGRRGTAREWGQGGLLVIAIAALPKASGRELIFSQPWPPDWLARDAVQDRHAGPVLGIEGGRIGGAHGTLGMALIVRDSDGAAVHLDTSGEMYSHHQPKRSQ